MYEHENFLALQKDVVERWDSIAQLLEMFDWDFFSDSGAVIAQGYEILDDAFKASCTMKEVATYVANEVAVIKTRRKNTQNNERSAELLAIGNWLIDYTRANFEEEIIKDYPELLRSYLRG